jgi:hypothetical protein
MTEARAIVMIEGTEMSAAIKVNVRTVNVRRVATNPAVIDRQELRAPNVINLNAKTSPRGWPKPRAVR